MLSFERMISAHMSIAKYYKSMQPSPAIIEAMQKNSRLVAQALGPHIQIAQDLQAAARAIAMSGVNFDQVRSLVGTYSAILPGIAKSFSVVSTFLESYRSTALAIPNYLSQGDFGLDAIFNTSKGLSEALDVVLGIAAERTVVPTLANAFISKPGISTTSHFRALEALKIIERQGNSILEEDFEHETESEWDGTRESINRTEPQWLTLLEGAEEAVASSNPDRVRHATTSLRELITQIIHRCAPDEAVHKMLIGEKWYSNKSPTRRARLNYILINRYGNDILLDFIEKDIEAIMALFDLFQKGTHEIVGSISPNQLKLILKRAKMLIGELIDKETS